MTPQSDDNPMNSHLQRRLAHGQIAGDFSPDDYPELRQRETDPELRVERYPALDASMIQLVVLDRQNRIHGSLALAADTITVDDSRWLVERVKRGLQPDLKIVG